MNKLEVSFHSMIDLITNSSSVVYIAAASNAPDTLHQMINDILKAGNSDTRSEDLFDIHISANADSIIDSLLDEEESALKEALGELVGAEAADKLSKDLSDASYKEWTGIWRNFESEYRQELSNFDYTDYTYSDYPQSSLVVTPKNPENAEAARLLSSLTNLFNYEASYN